MQVSFSFFYFPFLITVHVWGGLGNCVPGIQKEVSGHHGSQLCPPTVCTRNGTRIVRPRGKNFYVLSHLKTQGIMHFWCSLRKGFSRTERSRESWLHICIYLMHLLFYSVPGGHSLGMVLSLSKSFPFGKCLSLFAYLLCFNSNVILFHYQGQALFVSLFHMCVVVVLLVVVPE